MYTVAATTLCRDTARHTAAGEVNDSAIGFGEGVCTGGRISAEVGGVGFHGRQKVLRAANLPITPALPVDSA